MPFRTSIAFCGAWLVCVVTFAAPPAATELDDVPEKLAPAKTATEAQRNQTEAAALFAAGYTEEQRGKLSLALRLYQRALRKDPNALPIVRQIVEVARQLDRSGEILRYGKRAIELDPDSDSREFWNLADQLVTQGEFTSALRLYQHARALQTDKKSFTYLALTLQVGRLLFLNDRATEASVALDEVFALLRQPSGIELTKDQRRVLEGPRGENYEVIGAVMLECDRPDDALAAFEQAQKVQARPARMILRRAQVLAHKKQSQAALDELNRYLDGGENDEQLVPYELLAEVLEQLDRKADLIPQLEKLLVTQPDNVALKMFLARRYLQNDQPDRAQPLFESLQSKAPTIGGYRGLIEVYRRAGKYALLLATLAEATEKINGLESLADDMKKLGADPRAVDGLAEAARAEPADGSKAALYNGRMAAGLVALEAKRYPLAADMFELAVKTRPRQREAWLAWGLGLLRFDQHDEAAGVLRRAIDAHVLAADNPTFHTYLSMALELAGKTDEALAVAREAADIAEHSARAESRVGWVLYHARRYEAAAQIYRDLVAKFENDYSNDDVRRVVRESRLALSNIDVTLNKISQAEEWLEQVLDEFPDDVSALNDLGYLWADQGKNLARALEMVEQAVAAEPENAAYRDSLGWAYYRAGRMADAVRELELAAKEADPDGVIIEHLGDVYQAAGRRADAEQAWKRAVELLTKQGDLERAAKVTAKINTAAGKN